MRQEPNQLIEPYRQCHPTLGGSPAGVNFGFFRMSRLRIISSGTPEPGDGQLWEHVSVSCHDRCPTWDEMESVRRLFWREDETVVQIHPPLSEHVNCHPFTLHLWKPIDVEIPLPPRGLI